MTELQFQVEVDEWIPIERLMGMFHPNNSQVRDSHELEAIKRSIIEEGFVAELIVCNRWNQKIVSGHGRVQACWDLGHHGSLPVIWRDYQSEPEHRRAMLRWNRARGHQDQDLMAREIEALLAEFDKADVVADLAFASDHELDELLGRQTPLPEDPGPQVDRAEELREKWGVQTGQLWGIKPFTICPKCGKRHNL